MDSLDSLLVCSLKQLPIDPIIIDEAFSRQLAIGIGYDILSNVLAYLLKTRMKVFIDHVEDFTYAELLKLIKFIMIHDWQNSYIKINTYESPGSTGPGYIYMITVACIIGEVQSFHDPYEHRPYSIMVSTYYMDTHELIQTKYVRSDIESFISRRKWFVFKVDDLYRPIEDGPTFIMTLGHLSRRLQYVEFYCVDDIIKRVPDLPAITFISKAGSIIYIYVDNDGIPIKMTTNNAADDINYREIIFKDMGRLDLDSFMVYVFSGYTRGETKIMHISQPDISPNGSLQYKHGYSSLIMADGTHYELIKDNYGIVKRGDHTAWCIYDYPEPPYLISPFAVTPCAYILHRRAFALDEITGDETLLPAVIDGNHLEYWINGKQVTADWTPRIR